MAKDLAALVHAVPLGGTPSSGNPSIIAFNVNPTSGSGWQAPLGSLGICIITSTSTYQLYVKAAQAATGWQLLNASPSTYLPTDPFFGNGSDGAQTFDGSSTVLGLVPSSNVYTLSRDIFLADGSAINSGVTILPNGFRVFVSGNLTNNGTIQCNGMIGNNGTGGLNGTSNASGCFAAMGPGGNGGTNGSGGNSGASSTNAIGNPRWTQQSATNGAGGGNGQGGAGGAGGTAAGGQGGSIVVAPNSAGGLTCLSALTARADGNAFINSYSYGSGGGGGGCSAGNGYGGGGGGGGGWCYVGAKKLSGGGYITSNGGNGGNGNLGTTSTAAGGGGGGGGGIVYVIYETNPGGNMFLANGGTFGNKAGSGQNGNNGSAGTVVKMNLSGDGS